MGKTVGNLDKSVKTSLDNDFAAKNHTHSYAASSHTHNYAGSSSAGGAANSATKLATARTLTIGNTGKKFDGSANASWSLSEIGAVSLTDFNDLTIGGRNYVLDSKKETTTTSTYQTRNLSADTATDLAGKVVTFSFDLKSTTAGGNIYVYFRSSSGAINPVSQTIGAATTEYKRYSITFTAPTDLSTVVTASVHTTSAIGTAYLKNFKVELGHKATSWCYAIEEHVLNSTLTTELAKKANSSHGTHVTYSTTAPLVAGTAAVGSANNVARGDHVHAAQTSVSGNAGTATKLATARNITIGNKTNSFDGSANIAFTLTDIGALSTAGGTVTGDINIKNNHDIRSIAPNTTGGWANGYTFRDKDNTKTLGGFGIYGSGTSVNNLYMGYGESPWSSSIGVFINSDAVTIKGFKMGTARTLTIGNTGKKFDGSANVSWTLSDIGAKAAEPTTFQLLTNYVAVRTAGRTAAQYYEFWDGNDAGWAGIKAGAIYDNNNRVYSAGNKPTLSDLGAAAASHGTHVTWSTTAPKVAGTAAVGTETKAARGDHVHAAQTSVSGNAGTATKLKTARTLTIGSKGKTFDGSADVSWTLAEIGAAAASHNHDKIVAASGSAWTTAVQNPSAGNVLFHYNVSKSATGMFPNTNNANFIISLNKHSGNYSSQLGFNNEGNIYYRGENNVAISDSMKWKEIAFNGRDSSLVDVTTVGRSGSGKSTADTYASTGNCYKFTSTSTATTIYKCTFAPLHFGSYGLCVRLKASAKTSTSNIIQIIVYRGTKALKTVNIKGTQFTSTSQYQNFYTNIDYVGDGSAKVDLSVEIKSTTVSGIDLSFDYARIEMMNTGVFL